MIPSPYDYRPFPPHALLVSDLYDITSWLSGPLPKTDVRIKAAMQGTKDARDLYSWCPGRRHWHEEESNTELLTTLVNGLFVTPVEERLEWVAMLAGCELSSAVPILWRGCSSGCLDFLDGPPGNSTLNEQPTMDVRERDEDEEFMSMFRVESAKYQAMPSEEEEEALVEAQTQIVWDNMMDLDD